MTTRHDFRWHRLMIAAMFFAIAPMTEALADTTTEPLPIVAIHDAPKGSGSGAVSFLHPETLAILATVTVVSLAGLTKLWVFPPLLELAGA